MVDLSHLTTMIEIDPQDPLSDQKMVERVRKVVLALDVCNWCQRVNECEMWNSRWTCEECWAKVAEGKDHEWGRLNI